MSHLYCMFRSLSYGIRILGLESPNPMVITRSPYSVKLLSYTVTFRSNQLSKSNRINIRNQLSNAMHSLWPYLGHYVTPRIMHILKARYQMQGFVLPIRDYFTEVLALLPVQVEAAANGGTFPAIVSQEHPARPTNGVGFSLCKMISKYIAAGEMFCFSILKRAVQRTSSLRGGSPEWRPVQSETDRSVDLQQRWQLALCETRH